MRARDFRESGSGAPIFPEVDEDRVVHFLGVDDVTRVPIFMSSEKVYERIQQNARYIDGRVSTDRVHDPTGAIRALVLDVPHVQGLIMWSKEYHGKIVFGVRYMVGAHHLTWYAKLELNAGLRKRNTLAYIGELPCQSLLSRTVTYNFEATRAADYRDAPGVFSSRLATAISEKLSTRVHQTEHGILQTHVIIKNSGERAKMAIVLHWMANRADAEAIGEALERDGVELSTVGYAQDHPAAVDDKRDSVKQFAARVIETGEMIVDFMETACGDQGFLDTYGAAESSCSLDQNNTYYHSKINSHNQEMDIFFNCREIVTAGPHYAVGFPSGCVHECTGHVDGLLFPSFYDERESDGGHFYGTSSHRILSQPRERLEDFA